MMSENDGSERSTEADQPKQKRQLQRRLPKILEDGGFVMLFGPLRPPKQKNATTPESGAQAEFPAERREEDLASGDDSETEQGAN